MRWKVNLRLVRESDYESLWEIYQQYIETTITFEYVMPTLEAFIERIENIKDEYAYIVYEKDGQPLGYAYSHRFGERAGFNWTAELSVYTDKAAKGLGVGRQLYNALIDISKLQGIHTVFGVVAEGNDASIALHTKLGFQLDGVLKNVGFKNDSWLDCLYFAKEINAYDSVPNTFIPVSQLNHNELNAVFGG